MVVRKMHIHFRILFKTSLTNYPSFLIHFTDLWRHVILLLRVPGLLYSTAEQRRGPITLFCGFEQQ